jgi:hypothetical protein
VGDAVLKHNQELLIGNHRYRFEAAPPTGNFVEEGPEGTDNPRRTSGWQSISADQLFPSLVELTVRGEGERSILKNAENWLGRDEARCDIVITDDPFVSPRHARIFRDPKNRWHVENGTTVNGTWLRIDSMPLDTACQFQLGEQRFILKVL